MKNGYSKSQGEKVGLYTTANNVEYKGMRLSDYLENEIANLKYYIAHSQPIVLCGTCTDLTMSTTGDTQYKPSLNVRHFNVGQDSDNINIFEIDNSTGNITVVRELPQSHTPCFITFQAEVFHESENNVTNILRIKVIRNGNNITNYAQCQQVLATANKRYCMCAAGAINLQKGDIIQFTNATGVGGAKSYRNNYSIVIYPTLNGLIQEL